MASVPVFCILCAASLRKTGNRRQLFSASSRPLFPLLTTYASLICGQDRGLTTTTMDQSIESKRPWEEGSGKGFCHLLWASQRYKTVVTAKEMFHCQLLVWSQLAVSEGFGGITYCLADSNFGVSHGSISQVKSACILRSTIDKRLSIVAQTFFGGARCASCLLHFYNT